MVAVIGFEMEASLCALPTRSGTACSMSETPYAAENTILPCRAMATDMPGHFDDWNPRVAICPARRMMSSPGAWGLEVDGASNCSATQAMRTRTRCFPEPHGPQGVVLIEPYAPPQQLTTRSLQSRNRCGCYNLPLCGG